MGGCVGDFRLTTVLQRWEDDHSEFNLVRFQRNF